jgi:caa(3)-type oxidase subunit IV
MGKIISIPKPCTAIWMLLVGLTGVTYAVGEFGLGSGGTALLVLAIAVFKAQLVVDHFMGLRRVSGFWRPLIAGYLLVLGVGITLAFGFVE